MSLLHNEILSFKIKTGLPQVELDEGKNMADPAGCLGRTLPAEILSPGTSGSGSFSTLFQLFSNSTCFFLRPTSEFSIAALTISLTESLTLEVEGPGASFSLE